MKIKINRVEIDYEMLEKIDDIDQLEDICFAEGLKEIYCIGGKWFGARESKVDYGLTSRRVRVDGINLNEILEDHGYYINEEE